MAARRSPASRRHASAWPETIAAVSGHIKLARSAQQATLTISNPSKLNAIDGAMWRELRAHMEGLNTCADLRCVIIRGDGEEAFAAGGDIEEFQSVRATPEQALTYHDQWVAGALDAIRACPVPTIAAISGACIGGGLEIAGCCDLRIAGRSARFGAPINRLGFSMYPGEMQGLLALVGPAVLLEILLEGRVMGADEALAKGLLTRVVDDSGLNAEAQASADRICAGAPLVARWHKQWVHRLMRGDPLGADEKRAAFDFLDTDDYREGLEAFMAKRPPRFEGR